MDIKKFTPTAEIEYELDIKGDVSQKVKFTVEFVGQDRVPDYIRRGEEPKLSKIIKEALIDAIIAWDLTEDGKSLECNEQNKKRVLPFLLSLKVKTPKDESTPDVPRLDDFLGWALINFAGDEENFLKN